MQIAPCVFRLIILVLSSIIVEAQHIAFNYKGIDNRRVDFHNHHTLTYPGIRSSHSFNYSDPDTLFQQPGILPGDDPEFNPRSKWYIPAISVTVTNIGIWAFDRFALNADYSHIGLATAKKKPENRMGVG